MYNIIKKAKTIDFYSYQLIVVGISLFFLKPPFNYVIIMSEIYLSICFTFSLFFSKKYTKSKFKKYNWIMLLLFIGSLRKTIFDMRTLSISIANDDPFGIYIILLITNIIMNVFVVFSLDKVGFNLKNQGFKSVNKSIVVNSTLFLLSILIAYINININKNNFIIVDYTPFEFIISLIMITISGVITEEILFRGVFLNYLLDKFSYIESLSKRRGLAVLLSTIAFILMHPWINFLNPTWLISIILLSVFGCYSRFYSGNISYAILLHALFNTILNG